MFKKFFVLFLVCVLSAATLKTSEAAGEYSTVITNQIKKNKKNSKAKKKTKKSTKKVATKKKKNNNKKKYKKPKKSKTKNRTNYFLDEENNFIVSQEELPQEGQTNNDVLPDDSIIATTIDEQQNLNEDNNKNNNNNLIVEEKQPEIKQEEKRKSSFFDRFYVKTRIYGAYGINYYSTNEFFDKIYAAERNIQDFTANNISAYVSGGYGAKSIDPNGFSYQFKKSSQISFGAEVKLYFKINSLFSVFTGLDLRIADLTGHNKGPNFSLEYSLPCTGDKVRDFTNALTYLKFKSDFSFSQHGSLSVKIGTNIDIFRNSILQVAPYGLVGVSLSTLKINTPSYSEDFIPTSGNVDVSEFLRNVYNVETKKYNMGIVFGGGLEIIIIDRFVIGAEYTYSINKISGKINPTNMTKNTFYTANGANKPYTNFIYPVLGKFNDKLKTQTIIGKFGIQF